MTNMPLCVKIVLALPLFAALCLRLSFLDIPRYTARFPDLYEQLASGTNDGAHTTAALRSVDLDLYRTFPEHACFATGTPQGEMGVTSLRRVLHAYAAFDDELGYCQRYTMVFKLSILYNDPYIIGVNN